MTDELDAELAAWAESDAPVTVPGRILRGAAARAAGRRALAWAGYPRPDHSCRDRAQSNRQLAAPPSTPRCCDRCAAR